MCLALSGCFKDKGNYDYTEYAEAKVIIDGLGQTVVGEPVELVTSITFDEGSKYVSDDLTILWLVDMQEVACVEGKPNTYIFDPKTNGSYDVGVRITDNKTGAQYFLDKDISVKSPYEMGYLIITEEGGITDANFVSYYKENGIRNDDWEYITNDTIMFDKLYTKCISTNNEELSLGKYVGVSEAWQLDDYSTVIGQLALITEGDSRNQLHFFDGESLIKQTEIQDEFINTTVPNNFNPIAYVNTCWDSYVLSDDDKIYARRSGESNMFHTGIFGNTPLHGLDYNGLFLAHYPTTSVTILTEKDETGATNYVGVYSYDYNSRNNGARLDVSCYSDEELANFKNIGTLLYSDYIKDYSYEQYDITKSVNGDYFLHHYSIDDASYRNEKMSIGFSTKINLTERGVSDVMGIMTYKGYYYDCEEDNRYVYFYDKNTLYGYDDVNDEVKVMKTFNKNIVSMDMQSNGTGFAPEDAVPSYGIAFDDGTFEIYLQEQSPKNPFAIGSKVFPNENVQDNNFGNIKKVFFKSGSDFTFSY